VDEDEGVMKAVNLKAQNVLTYLYNLASIRGHAKLDNSGGTFMPVSVDVLGDDYMAVAHNYVSNGDLIPDPDMTFRRDGGLWYAISIQHSTGHHVQAVNFDENGKPKSYNKAQQADLTSFANQWMKNIIAQQELKL
jgi:hypothetical protein